MHVYFCLENPSLTLLPNIEQNLPPPPPPPKKHQQKTKKKKKKKKKNTKKKKKNGTRTLYLVSPQYQI